MPTTMRTALVLVAALSFSYGLAPCCCFVAQPSRTANAASISRSRHRVRRRPSPSSSSAVAVDGGGGGGGGATLKAPPRTGLAQAALDLALRSPLWKHLLVPQARATMVRTAEANGIPWRDARAWLEDNAELTLSGSDGDGGGDGGGRRVPEYYRRPFHAYEDGNLCWDAALEQEIASCAVGARNFPRHGPGGEDAFRGAFDAALREAGASAPDSARMIDVGCGTGTSTRRLAAARPSAAEVVGVDLSPHFVAVGRELLRLAPTSFREGGTWVNTVVDDERIEYVVGDAADTGLEAASFDVVNAQFVLHELPPAAALDVVREASRVLRPNGQLWICEMDFESPAYAAQRANALLFSLLRSTEPYLDDYAESTADLFRSVASEFETVRVVPATGRHYALVATKGEEGGGGGGESFSDLRFREDGTYRVEDTHLQKFWESKHDEGGTATIG